MAEMNVIGSDGDNPTILASMLRSVGLDREEYLLLPARERMKLERRYTFAVGPDKGKVDWSSLAEEAMTMIAAWKRKHGSMPTRLERR